MKINWQNILGASYTILGMIFFIFIILPTGDYIKLFGFQFIYLLGILAIVSGSHKDAQNMKKVNSKWKE